MSKHVKYIPCHGNENINCIKVYPANLLRRFQKPVLSQNRTKRSL